MTVAAEQEDARRQPDRDVGVTASGTGSEGWLPHLMDTGSVTCASSGVDPAPVWVAWASDREWSARELLHAEASRVTSIPLTALRSGSSCPECGSSAHGRPFLVTTPSRPVPHVSLSRASGIVVVALTAAGPVGVDVEREAGASFDGFDDMALHASECADGPVERTATWVRKESLLKAAGHGLTTDLRSVRLGSPRRPPEVLSWEQNGSWPDVGVWMYDVLDAPVGYVVSVTVLSEECPTLVTRRAAGAGPSGRARP